MRTRTLSDMGALDKRLYTSHHAPTDNPDHVKIARTGCMSPSAVRLSLSRYCTHQLHPCTVLTAAHHIHTRPPALQARLACQRPLVNPYHMFDLCRPQQARQRQGNPGRRAFPVTRNGAGLDLPGSGRGRSDMSDPEDTSQAARGGSRFRGGRAPAREDDRS